MGDTTQIEWCDHTFNPWMGCTKISPGCDHCYACTMADQRFGRAKWGGPGQGVGSRTRTSAANWRKPIAWNKAAATKVTRPFVFCASLADVFDNAVDPAWRADAFALMRQTPNLVYLLLTKRPQNILKMAEAAGGLPSNAALGTSICVQDEVRNVGLLAEAKRRLNPVFAFVSAEPLLEAVDLSISPDFGAIDWVIVGGEAGRGARPMHLDWARAIKRQCDDFGSIFNFKQTGAVRGHGLDTLDGVAYHGRPAVALLGAQYVACVCSAWRVSELHALLRGRVAIREVRDDDCSGILVEPLTLAQVNEIESELGLADMTCFWLNEADATAYFSGHLDPLVIFERHSLDRQLTGPVERMRDGRFRLRRSGSE
jgi:protein gp37